MTLELWKYLQTPHSGAQLCAYILEEFEVSPADCERDVLAFLEALHAEQLVEPVVDLVP